MYCPEVFRENRLEVLHDAIDRTGLATLATLHADGLIASHVPMLLDRQPAPYGTLLGHLARPNPQAEAPVVGLDALAIFQPIDGYITTSWYATKQQTGKVVPTWNYVAVHAYGRITFFSDQDRLRELVTRLTERQEAARSAPWAVGDAPAEFMSGMLKGIVGFAVALTRIEGKWKMSQNRPAADVAGVVAGLRSEGRTDLADEVASANASR